MKKYIKTLEELSELKFTDTQIYDERKNGYYRFVDDDLCWYGTSNFIYNTSLTIDTDDRFYIEVLEDEYKDEIDHNDFGMLCIFWDNENTPREEHIGILTDIIDGNNFPYECNNDCVYKHCRRVTKEEIEKYL